MRYKSLFKASFFLAMGLLSHSAFAHYPLLDCYYGSEGGLHVYCDAGFSDRSKAPNVMMEVFSEDDEVIAQGRTDENALFDFKRPDGAFFIIMDAGPGHVIEISDDEVRER
ncbi:hypothetical protein [Alkalimarinus coralli]|uniref:hypothetical protein n=1 Tax=Alkalimarinus coralli TaxID=2935863 RepID=UPI00202B0B8E|nr:hypothetical protein [Alkalimarinus coralli]